MKYSSCMFLTGLFFSQAAFSQTTISSLAELIDLQDASNRNIKMVPGTYHISSSSKNLFDGNDWRVNEEGNWPGLLKFTGNNNTFDLTGVTITFDSTIINEMRNLAHGNLVELGGNNNEWLGFNLQEIPSSQGNYGVYRHSSGGTVLQITGSRHEFQNLTLKSRFSYPYGFGSMYGKTGSNSGRLPGLRLSKKSGLLLTELTDSYFNNVLVDHSAFGHTLFLNGPIDDVVIENAVVRAESRSTNDLRSDGTDGTDRNGVPFSVSYDGRDMIGRNDNPTFFSYFNTSNLNRCQNLGSGNQNAPIQNNYQFSLTEAAFRGYTQEEIKGLTIRNATVDSARMGIALGSAGRGLVVENMNITGIAGHGVPSCGGWNGDNGGEGDATALDLPSDATAKDVKADAAYATVLEIGGARENITADIEILDPKNGYLRPSGSTALALISGDDHKIRLWKRDGRALGEDLVVKVGNDNTSDLLLCNMTEQSVNLSNRVRNSTIYSIGDVNDSSNGSNDIIRVANLGQEPRVCSDLGTPISNQPSTPQPSTPVAPQPTEPTGNGTVVQIKKRNAQDFAIDGGHNGANSQNVYLWAQNRNNVNQQWIEIDRGNGYYSYQKQNTNFCLDGNRGGANRQNVYLWECRSNNQNQHWQKVNAGSGFVKLVKRNASDFALDGGSGGSNGQNVNLYDASNASRNLHWSITPVN